MATESDIAQWMIDRITSEGLEYQEVMVSEIRKKFGRLGVYQNENGNPAINKKVLDLFRKLHGGSIEWDRSEKSWSVVGYEPQLEDE